jgi:hypothetical protein
MTGVSGCRIPPLIAGGIMPSWRCSNACRHCLYYCSPRQPDEWMDLGLARRIFAALAREPRLVELHIGGGEPFLRPDRLIEIVRLASETSLPLAYVETNAFWCTDRERTRDLLRSLRTAGLPGLLVSVSMFHNEFVPFRSMRIAVETAIEVFGSAGVIVYLPHMYELLGRLPDDGKHALQEFCRFFDLERSLEALPRLYGVIPGGRATSALRESYVARRAINYEHVRCDNLLGTTHFHIDPHGFLFTGLCAGIAVATVDDFHPKITPASHPIATTLLADGPCGLMRSASERHGYRERDVGYVSACDLCIDVRAFMRRAGDYPELSPDEFYLDLDRPTASSARSVES